MHTYGRVLEDWSCSTKLDDIVNSKFEETFTDTLSNFFR